MKEEYTYAPSPDKVVEEEADNPHVRGNADLFVDQLYRLMDEAEHGPHALVPTPQTVLELYKEAASQLQEKSADVFTLQHSYGAAKRKLLHDHELAARSMEAFGTVNPLAMKNMGKLYSLQTAFELALPKNEPPEM